MQWASLFLVLASVACHQSPPAVEEHPAVIEEHPVSWLNPSDQALMDAATAGFQGKDPETLWLKKSDSPTILKCQGDITGVALFTPLRSAQFLGYDNRKHFENAPTLSDLTKKRYSASVYIFYGASRPDDEASVAVSAGGTIFKPKDAHLGTPEVISCGEYLSPMWSLSVEADFGGQDALPTSGKGTLIVRRSGKEDANIDIDFDSIPTSFTAPQQ